MERVENNRLIAEFMAFQTRTDAVDDRVLAYYVGDVIKNADNSKNENEENVFHPEDMQFDTDWNWLMSVVEKTLTVGDDTNQWDNVLNELQTVSIDNVYQSVIEFIKWYNLNK